MRSKQRELKRPTCQSTKCCRWAMSAAQCCTVAPTPSNIVAKSDVNPSFLAMLKLPAACSEPRVCHSHTQQRTANRADIAHMPTSDSLHVTDQTIEGADLILGLHTTTHTHTHVTPCRCMPQGSDPSGHFSFQRCDEGCNCGGTADPQTLGFCRDSSKVWYATDVH